MSRCHQATWVLGLAAAAVLSLPLLSTAVAAPAKKKPVKAVKKKPPKPGDNNRKGDAKAGMELFKSEGCTGCHKTADYKDGGTQGPDLSTEGKEKKVDIIAGLIMHPKTGSIMPATKDKKKAADLAAYLLTQK